MCHSCHSEHLNIIRNDLIALFKVNGSSLCCKLLTEVCCFDGDYCKTVKNLATRYSFLIVNVEPWKGSFVFSLFTTENHVLKPKQTPGKDCVAPWIPSMGQWSFLRKSHFVWTRQVPHNHTGYVCLSSRSSLDRDNWFTLIQLCLIIRKRSVHANGHTNPDRPSSPPPLLPSHFLLSAPNKLSIGLSSGKQLFFLPHRNRICLNAKAFKRPHLHLSNDLTVLLHPV